MTKKKIALPELKPETVGFITELAQEVFRQYGFKAESAHVDHTRGSGTLEIQWKEEEPQGMARFSQKKITAYMVISSEEWKTDEFKALNPWDLWALLPASPWIRLGVSYEHCFSGSNGWSTDYKIVTTSENKQWLTCVQSERF